MPWEVIFALANTLGKDAWINIPISGESVIVGRACFQLRVCSMRYTSPSSGSHGRLHHETSGASICDA